MIHLWLPFGIGSIYSVRKEMNIPVHWGYPTATLTTTSILSMFRQFALEPTFDAQSVKRIPGTFAGVMMVQGSIFCLGHLMTKMAYPIFQEKQGTTYTIPGKGITIQYGK